jgi:tRNA threonylcarbamoyladenosine biosynthesis protein TsaB
MRILGLDAATSWATVAVTDTWTQFVQTWRAGPRFSDTLALRVEEALRTIGGVGELDAIAVGIGPGSYTGIRVALALGKGLCLASGLPLVGISTLETVAYGCGGWQGKICAVLPAGSGRVGVGVFQGPWAAWARVGDERAASLESAGSAIVPGSLTCGEGARLLRSGAHTLLAPRAFDAPRGDVLTCLAEAYFENGGPDQSMSVQPNYLRQSSPEERLATAEASS